MHIDPKPIRAAAVAPAAPSPRPRWRGPGRHLLAQILERAGGHARLLHHAERRWATVTFTGKRHTIALRFAGADGLRAGEGFIDALADMEFTIPGQIVADAAVIAVDHAVGPAEWIIVRAELLLVEDQRP